MKRELLNKRQCELVSQLSWFRYNMTRVAMCAHSETLQLRAAIKRSKAAQLRLEASTIRLQRCLEAHGIVS